MTSASVLTRCTASVTSSDSWKNRVTSSMPSMNTHDRTFENWLAIAYTNCSVKRAKLATDPEMSATTMISGRDGRGWRNLGSAGTPPYDSECRTVDRKSRWPRLRRRRRCEPSRQRARQRVDGALEGEHLLARRVHEVDVLGEGLAQRARH